MCCVAPTDVCRRGCFCFFSFFILFISLFFFLAGGAQGEKTQLGNRRREAAVNFCVSGRPCDRQARTHTNTRTHTEA